MSRVCFHDCRHRHRHRHRHRWWNADFQLTAHIKHVHIYFISFRIVYFVDLSTKSAIFNEWDAMSALYQRTSNQNSLNRLLCQSGAHQRRSFQFSQNLCMVFVCAKELPGINSLAHCMPQRKTVKHDTQSNIQT